MGTPVEKFIRDAHQRFNVKYALTNDRMRAIRTKLKMADIQSEVRDEDTSLALDIVLADYGMGSATLRTAGAPEFQAALQGILIRLSRPGLDETASQRQDEFILTTSDKIFSGGPRASKIFSDLWRALLRRGATREELKKLMLAWTGAAPKKENTKGLDSDLDAVLTAGTRTASVTSPMAKDAHPGLRNAGMCPRCSHSMQFAKLAESEETRYCPNCHVCVLV